LKNGRYFLHNSPDNDSFSDILISAPHPVQVKHDIQILQAVTIGRSARIKAAIPQAKPVILHEFIQNAALAGIPVESFMPPSISGRFNATRWSIVIAARGGADGSRRRCALEELALAYWPPLYAYLRREGYAPDRAEDLTQEFFARLLEKHALSGVDPTRGKFRSFLLASLKHFLANEWDKQNALKRGGGVRTLSLSAADAESRCSLDPADPRTPEQLFNHRWALTVLNAVIDRLRKQYADKDQLPLFDALQATLTGELQEGYAATAARLGTTEGALQAAAHRLRKRYRELLREEIAQTVSDPSLIDEEMRDLLNAL